jgi:hypothetical protein
MKWRPANWIEHATFGIGQVSEIREDKLDIDFLNHGRRIEAIGCTQPDLQVHSRKTPTPLVTRQT